MDESTDRVYCEHAPSVNGQVYIEASMKNKHL